MLGHIAGDLAAAGGMTDMDDILQAERLDEGKGICCVMFHIVTIGHLGGSAMATAVMGDDAKTFRQEEQHLRVPVIGR